MRLKFYKRNWFTRAFVADAIKRIGSYGKTNEIVRNGIEVKRVIFSNEKNMEKESKKELEARIIAALKQIYDPEIPVDIFELGLIYEVKIKDDGYVEIDMTLTSPNCPVAESLPVDVKNKIESVDDVNECKVNIVFDPPWDKDMMSEEAQLELGFL